MLGVRAQESLDAPKLQALEALADQAAVALERVRLATEAARTAAMEETPRLRTALLAAHPWLAGNIFNAFNEARRRSLARILHQGVTAVPLPWRHDARVVHDLDGHALRPQPQAVSHQPRLAPQLVHLVLCVGE